MTEGSSLLQLAMTEGSIMGTDTKTEPMGSKEELSHLAGSSIVTAEKNVNFAQTLEKLPSVQQHPGRQTN